MLSSSFPSLDIIYHYSTPAFLKSIHILQLEIHKSTPSIINYFQSCHHQTTPSSGLVTWTTSPSLSPHLQPTNPRAPKTPMRTRTPPTHALSPSTLKRRLRTPVPAELNCSQTLLIHSEWEEAAHACLQLPNGLQLLNHRLFRGGHGINIARSRQRRHRQCPAPLCQATS